MNAGREQPARLFALLVEAFLELLAHLRDLLLVKIAGPLLVGNQLFLFLQKTVQLLEGLL